MITHHPELITSNLIGQRIFAGLAALVLGALWLNRIQAVEPNAVPFRLAFSRSMFTDVNDNDAKAAIKVWGQTVAKERGIPTDPEPTILEGVPALSRALQNQQVDGVGMTLVEYEVLSREVRFTPIFVSYSAGRVTERYVLLTHQENRITSLADLCGRSLVVYENPRVCLAQPWLDTLLVQQGFKPAAEFVGKITRNNKLSKTVLPVFFHQSDACLVTRSGFETMAELNPQVSKQLKIIATSPEVVPSVFCFRADYGPAFKEALFASVRELHKTPAGQQVLTIFHSDRIEDQPASCLDSAMELLATHRKVCGSAPASSIAFHTPLSAVKEAVVK